MDDQRTRWGKLKTYVTKEAARVGLARKTGMGWFIDRYDDGTFVLRQRCAYCGAAKINGRCPVERRDCGRPR